MAKSVGYQKKKSDYKRKDYRNYRKGRNVAYRASRALQSYSSDNSVAYKAFRMAKRLSKAVNVEYKFVKKFLSAIYSYDGALVILNDPAQGDTDTTRDGDSIKNQHLVIRGTINQNVGLTISGSNIRIIILYDRDSKVVNPNDVLDPASVSTVFATAAAKNYDKRFQTKILYDQTFTTSYYGMSTRNFEIDCVLDFHTQFENGTTTINSGKLWMLIISDIAPSLAPVVNWNSRVTYTDN